MDNSISKALIMVASVLLAMIVIAFITHSFMQIGNWATTTDQEVLTKQLQEFNKEYEVYDKSLMYGVDVISCLNKALSNNQRIVDKKVVNGEQYDESYEVKVKVVLTKKGPDGNLAPLEESITVRYIEDASKGNLNYTDGDGPTKRETTQKYKLSDIQTEKGKKFSFLSSDYKNISTFKENTEFKSQIVAVEKLKNVFEFNITAQKNGNNEEETRALLSLANSVSEIIKNTDSETNSGKGNWSQAEFKSALYDLKTRRFKCVTIKYSPAGRINYIEFKEI